MEQQLSELLRPTELADLIQPLELDRAAGADGGETGARQHAHLWQAGAWQDVGGSHPREQARCRLL